MMTPQEYFEKYYKEDYEVYKNTGVACLCGRTLSKFVKDEELFHRFKSFKDFLYMQYELNLISQIMHSHFRVDYDKWLEMVPEYVDCRCSYETSPIRILENAKRESKGDMVFKYDELLEWDKFFMNMIEKGIEDGELETLTKDSLIKAIKEDPDCDIDKLIKILN